MSAPPTTTPRGDDELYCSFCGCPRERHGFFTCWNECGCGVGHDADGDAWTDSPRAPTEREPTHGDAAPQPPKEEAQTSRSLGAERSSPPSGSDAGGDGSRAREGSLSEWYRADGAVEMLPADEVTRLRRASAEALGHAADAVREFHDWVGHASGIGQVKDAMWRMHRSLQRAGVTVPVAIDIDTDWHLSVLRALERARCGWNPDGEIHVHHDGKAPWEYAAGPLLSDVLARTNAVAANTESADATNPADKGFLKSASSSSPSLPVDVEEALWKLMNEGASRDQARQSAALKEATASMARALAERERQGEERYVERHGSCPHKQARMKAEAHAANMAERALASEVALREAQRLVTALLGTPEMVEEFAYLDHGIGTETTNGKLLLACRAWLRDSEGPAGKGKE